jgi:hypothetical protein
MATRPDVLAAARHWPLVTELDGVGITRDDSPVVHGSSGLPVGRAGPGGARSQPLRSLDEVLVATGFRPPNQGSSVNARLAGELRRDQRDGARGPAACTSDPRQGRDAPAASARARPIDGPDGVDPDDHAGPCDAADSVLLALVTIAGSDELAARVVLQRLLPGLSAIARRHGRCMEEHLLAFDDLLSVAWWVIRRFPVERRRRHIAASLLRDCEHQAFRREGRRLLVHEYMQPELLDRAVELDAVDQEPLLEVLELIGEARLHHLHDGDLELLGVLLGAGLLRDAAAELRVSVRTVRNHRDAVVHRLRAALAA